MPDYFYSTTIPTPNGVFRASGIVHSPNAVSAYKTATKKAEESASARHIAIDGDLTLDTFNKVS